MSYEHSQGGVGPGSQVFSDNADIGMISRKTDNISLQDNEVVPKGRKKRPARVYHGTAATDYGTNVEGSYFDGSPQMPLRAANLPLPESHPACSSQGMNEPAVQNTAQAMEDPQSLSIARTRYLDQGEYMTPVSEDEPAFKSFFTFQNIVPPTAGTQFHTVDQGTASAKFIRATMYNVPETEQLRKATKLPVSVTIRPFAPLLPTEEPVPVVDARQIGNRDSSDPLEMGPPRCRRCRAYMNPAMQHTYHNRFICNICQFGNNSVPDDYTSMINFETNSRTDVYSRPELHKGVYDFIVPDAYNVKGPGSVNNTMHHVFLIDITAQSVRQSLISLIVDSIRSTVFNPEFEDADPGSESKFKGKIAIIAYDKRLKYYNLSSALSSTQLSISSDLDDPFVPFDEGLFADVEESRYTIESALNHIESLASADDFMPDTEPCLGAACRAAMACLENVGGGKITCLLSALPSWGPGALKFKDNKALGRTDSNEAEKDLFKADNSYFVQLAKDFITKFVSLDCFVVSPTSVDLSNIGWLCSITGGSVYKWSNFTYDRDAKAFTNTFKDSILKTIGYQGQLKLRCSNGLQVALYYGTSSSMSDPSFAGTEVQDPVIPVLNEDQTFTILFTYDGKLNTKYDCHFQAALLYTDKDGLRKVRVINLVLAVSETLDEVFNFVEEDAVVTTMVRDTLSFLQKQSLFELRHSINEKLVDVFTQYRAMSELGHMKYRANYNQLLFPDSLKHLPLYLLAFLKSRALKDSKTLSADSRLLDVFHFLNMPVEKLTYHLYPALVELHSLEEDDCLVSNENLDDLDHFVKLPLFKTLDINQLLQSVYVLCDGFVVYIWIHPNANILLLRDLFGENINSVEDISPLMCELPKLSTHISLQTRNLIRFFQKEIIGNSRPGGVGTQIVRLQYDTIQEAAFFEHFVEDAGKGLLPSNITYSEYLSNLHKAIRVKLDNDKSSSDVKNSVLNSEKGKSTLAQRLRQF